MWLLLIIVLGSEPPYGHRGSIQNFYTTEQQCNQELRAVIAALSLTGTQITGSCEFRSYLTPKKTF